jgi:hypothetical protein
MKRGHLALRQRALALCTPTSTKQFDSRFEMLESRFETQEKKLDQMLHLLTTLRVGDNVGVESGKKAQYV